MAQVEIVRGFYTCIKCGNSMLTALVTERGGRLVLHLEPLYCPRCVSESERQKAWKRLRDLRGWR
jgi:hypothetical protein